VFGAPLEEILERSDHQYIHDIPIVLVHLHSIFDNYPAILKHKGVFKLNYFDKNELFNFKKKYEKKNTLYDCIFI
jgi:hypothetical protein